MHAYVKYKHDIQSLNEYIHANIYTCISLKTYIRYMHTRIHTDMHVYIYIYEVDASHASDTNIHANIHT